MRSPVSFREGRFTSHYLTGLLVVTRGTGEKGGANPQSTTEFFSAAAVFPRTRRFAGVAASRSGDVSGASAGAGAFAEEFPPSTPRSWATFSCQNFSVMKMKGKNEDNNFNITTTNEMLFVERTSTHFFVGKLDILGLSI